MNFVYFITTLGSGINVGVHNFEEEEKKKHECNALIDIKWIKILV